MIWALVLLVAGCSVPTKARIIDADQDTLDAAIESGVGVYIHTSAATGQPVREALTSEEETTLKAGGTVDGASAPRLSGGYIKVDASEGDSAMAPVATHRFSVVDYDGDPELEEVVYFTPPPATSEGGTFVVGELLGETYTLQRKQDHPDGHAHYWWHSDGKDKHHVQTITEVRRLADLPIFSRPTYVIGTVGQSNIPARGVLDDVTAPVNTGRIFVLSQEMTIIPCAEPADADAVYPVYPNMQENGIRDFAGPHTAMADALANEYPDYNFLIVPSAKGGTISAQWTPKLARDNFYGSLLSRLLHALRIDGTQLAAVLVLQGESEAGSDPFTSDWIANWRETIAALRTDLDAPSLPVGIGQHWPSHDSETRPTWDDLRVAEATLAQDAGNFSWATPDGPFNSDTMLHLSTAGLEVMGANMAAAIISAGAIE